MKDVCLILYPVADFDDAKKFFRELTGADPYVDSAQYVGFKNGETEIGLVSKSGRPNAEALVYWAVDDIAASIKSLQSAGGVVVQEITDVGYGMLVASIKDANGVTVGLRQPPKG